MPQLCASRDHESELSTPGRPACQRRLSVKLELVTTAVSMDLACIPRCSLKDRNRLAQRKYRQRRKEQAHSTEERLAYLEAKVESLSSDKARDEQTAEQWSLGIAMCAGRRVPMLLAEAQHWCASRDMGPSNSKRAVHRSRTHTGPEEAACSPALAA